MSTKDTIYKSSLVAYLSRVDACDEAIRWLCDNYHAAIPLDHLLAHAPADWILWVAGSNLAIRYRLMIPREVFDRCVELEPWAALAYAPLLLTSAQLATCARRFPSTALRCAKSILPVELLLECEHATAVANAAVHA